MDGSKSIIKGLERINEKANTSINYFCILISQNFCNLVDYYN